jgi:hypothetical protein
MMPPMVKEGDLNQIDVPQDYEVLDATALGRRLGFKRDTVLAYLSRRNFRRIPRPNSPERTSDAYLAPTASLPWDRSGTRRASGSGRRRSRIGVW